MSFTPNDEGIEQLFAEIARKIERVDADIRATYIGQPVGEIKVPLVVAFASIGVPLDPEQVEPYAQSISNGEPFEIRLQ